MRGGARGSQLRGGGRDRDTPVLFMVGEKDGVAPPAMRKLSEALPGSRYVELPGAGHISNLDQPQAFTKAIQDFLKAA